MVLWFLLASGVVALALIARISRYRRGVDWKRFRKNVPSTAKIPPMTWIELLDKEGYMPEGQRLIPWLVLTLLTFFCLVVILIAQRL